MNELNTCGHVEITSYDGSSNREQRLCAVVGFLFGVLDERDFSWVVALHDHKGCLTITTQNPLQAHLRRLLEGFWGSDICCEHTESVEYSTISVGEI